MTLHISSLIRILTCVCVWGGEKGGKKDGGERIGGRVGEGGRGREKEIPYFCIQVQSVFQDTV